jgi:hypothetical protein
VVLQKPLAKLLIHQRLPMLVMKSRTHKLGYELQQLDLALAPRSVALLKQRQQVVVISANTGRIAGGIQAGDAGSNHPFLQNDMAAARAVNGHYKI